MLHLLIVSVVFIRRHAETPLLRGETPSVILEGAEHLDMLKRC